MINPTLIYNGVTQVQKWDFSTFTAIKCVQLSEPKLGEEPPVLASLEPLFKNSLRSLQTMRNQLSLQVHVKKTKNTDDSNIANPKKVMEQWGTVNLQHTAEGFRFPFQNLWETNCCSNVIQGLPSSSQLNCYNVET